MSNFVQFTAPTTDNPKVALAAFVAYCRETLTLYEDQGGFNVCQWTYIDNLGKRHAMRFAEYSPRKNAYHFTPFQEPFLSFAQSWVRFNQEKEEVTSVGNMTTSLATIYDALRRLGRAPCILEVDGPSVEEASMLIRERNSKGRRYQIGNELELLCNFLRENAICPALPIWINPFPRERYRAQGTTKEDKEWQEERCPSLHQMLQLADIFRQAEDEKDLYWSSVIALLMFAPSRGSELSSLMIDSLIEEDGRLYVRWYPRKSREWMQKIVPTQMEPVVREAFDRLIHLGQRARAAAMFAYKNPDDFFRHDECITSDDFDEDEPLDALQFAYARGISNDVIEKLEGLNRAGKSIRDKTAWNILGASTSNWLKKLLSDGPMTYRKLAIHSRSEYCKTDWPNIPGSNRPIWDSLTIILDRQFHYNWKPNLFSWMIPDVNAINVELAGKVEQGKSGSTIRRLSIFERFEKVDEDGSQICLTSHMLRVWLSTWAERAGMDSWQLAQWAGRARVDDNKAYDLRSMSEKYEAAKAVLVHSKTLNAVELAKLNLPVTYEALGIDRPGVVHPTLYGFCVHDWAMAPCIKGGGKACASCDDHACVKGLDDKLENLEALEAGISRELQRAAREIKAETFMADIWFRFLGFRLAKIRTIISELKNPDRPDGAIVRVPPEFDPSPLQRARASVIPESLQGAKRSGGSPAIANRSLLSNVTDADGT